MIGASDGAHPDGLDEKLASELRHLVVLLNEAMLKAHERGLIVSLSCDRGFGVEPNRFRVISIYRMREL